MKFMLVAGARPNFMKVAPLVRVFGRRTSGDIVLVHTGQHYDYEMSRVFFEELELPKPDYFLNVGSGTHAEQTAKIMVNFEKVCIQEKPDIVIVVGDVNSTLACAIVAKKLDTRVAHVEGGLRSGDMSMPEEINRLVTDSISDYLFVSERSGLVNLKREGRNDEQVFFVGNVMIDTLYHQLGRLNGKKSHADNLRYEKGYGVVTLHRPSNVDHEETLHGIIEALTEISEDLPIIFPVHPRTRASLESFGIIDRMKDSNIKLYPPLSYMEFLTLWKEARAVFTDSGGIQEETTALGIPCFTLRDNTERPITVEEGTNVLAGTTKEKILGAYATFRRGLSRHGKVPELWDGKAAERIVDILLNK